MQVGAFFPFVVSLFLPCFSPSVTSKEIWGSSVIKLSE